MRLVSAILYCASTHLVRMPNYHEVYGIQCNQTVSPMCVSAYKYNVKDHGNCSQSPQSPRVRPPVSRPTASADL